MLLLRQKPESRQFHQYLFAKHILALCRKYRKQNFVFYFLHNSSSLLSCKTENSTNSRLRSTIFYPAGSVTRRSLNCSWRTAAHPRASALLLSLDDAICTIQSTKVVTEHAKTTVMPSKVTLEIQAHLHPPARLNAQLLLRLLA